MSILYQSYYHTVVLIHKIPYKKTYTKLHPRRSVKMKCMGWVWYNIPKNCRSLKRFFFWGGLSLHFHLLRFWAVKICHRTLQGRTCKKWLLLLVSFHLLKGRASNSYRCSQTNTQNFCDALSESPDDLFYTVD